MTKTSSIPLNLHPGSKDLEFYNIERVRSFLEDNLGCKKKEVICALNLNPRTVAKASKSSEGRVPELANPPPRT
jgi:hypothetical protein